MKLLRILLYFILLALFLLPSYWQYQSYVQAPSSPYLALAPIQQNGRVKPIDTLARDYLKQASQKEFISQYPNPSLLLFQLMSCPKKIEDFRFFRIDHPDLQNLFSKNKQAPWYSFIELQTQKETIKQLLASQKAHDVSYQTQLQELHDIIFTTLSMTHSLRVDDHENFSQEWQLLHQDRLTLELTHNLEERYSFVNKVALFSIIPQKNVWLNAGEASLLYLKKQENSIHWDIWMQLVIALQNDDNKQVHSLSKKLFDLQSPIQKIRLVLEFVFNLISPFSLLSNIIFIHLLMLLFSHSFAFIKRSQHAFTFYMTAFLLVSCMLLRVFLQQRPPITDLYSSCLFVACMSFCLSLIFSRKSKVGQGILVAGCLIGFVCLKISENLTHQVDTMAPLRAVLDTNFWLATHVVMITTGYALSFLLGTLSSLIIIYLNISPKKAKQWPLNLLEKKLYPLLFFSLVFSFAGTVLGGIWADQAWGRFWGWDPKENGALMIVLWQAICLHGYRLRAFSGPAFLCMNALLSIVTAWSWFGVNLLGVGLHSYGFLDNGLSALIGFVFIQSFIASLAFRLNRFSHI